MAAEVETCYRHPTEQTRVHCTRCERPICPDCMTAAPVGHHCPSCVAEGARDLGRRRMHLRRPRSATVVILAILAAVFVVELVLGGATSVEVLVRMGAMVPVLVAEGEYWRLLSAMFLHVGALHLLLNAYGLFLFGSLVEGVLGPARLVAVYLVTGFVASSVSFAFGGPFRVAAGASGALFGLLGTWLAYNWRRRELFAAQANVRGALMLIVLNLALGLSFPGIDNLAHVGGLAAGVVAGAFPDGRRRAPLIAGLAALAIAGIALAAWRVSALSPLT